MSIETGMALTATWSYNARGQVTSVHYPDTRDVAAGGTIIPGITFDYTFDSMGRPNKMTESGGPEWVKDVLYNAAGQMTQMQVSGISHLPMTMTYNALGQLTRMTQPGRMDMEYRFPTTQNDGRITQSKDWISGEEVTYQYDELNRLASAVTTGPAWGLAWVYDGFGNRLQQNVTKGSAPTQSLLVSGVTNRITTSGFAYDANGNMTANPQMPTMIYDTANRLIESYAGSNTSKYTYDHANKRVYKHAGSASTAEFYFYGWNGELMGAYKKITTTAWEQKWTNVSFAGRLIQAQSKLVITDRLGSVRWRYDGINPPATLSYYPYGEQIGSLGSNTHSENRFATYVLDHNTGLNYADPRYHTATYARFLTADPYQASAGKADPGSWNRYAYVQGDPVNFNDPRGLEMCTLETDPATGIFRMNCTFPGGGHSGGGGGGGRDHPSLEVPPDFPGPGIPEPLGGDRVLRSADFPAEACTVSMSLTMSCDSDDYAISGLLGRFGVTLGTAWWIMARTIGGTGERIVGNILNLQKNTDFRLRETLSGRIRIPDFWDQFNKTIVEVKNASEVSFSSQIRDMAFWAQQHGYTFQLWVNRDSTLSLSPGSAAAIFVAALSP